MLEFLFVAELYNGEIYKQTPLDVSLTDPKRSAFYDIKDKKIKRFTLIGRGHIFTVDLTNGNIEVDGNVMYSKPPPQKTDLRLIYYRQVQQRLVIGEDGKGRQDPIIRYFIGWQATLKGKNYKFELGVD